MKARPESHADADAGGPWGPIAAAVLDPDRPAPPGLVAWNGSDPGVRLDVHRNTRVCSLTEALGDAFPVLCALVGEGPFAGLARAFIAAHPPRSPVLTEWGGDLPGFLSRAEPVATRPWLADLARLEWAWLAAWHAVDALPLSGEVLAARLADPAGLPAARLRLHPAAAALASPYAIVSLWHAGQGPGGFQGVGLATPEAALVVRPAAEALVVPVPTGTAALVGAIAAGLPLGEAVAAAVRCDPGLDLPLALAVLIRHGALAAWD